MPGKEMVGKDHRLSDVGRVSFGYSKLPPFAELHS